jgi:hypothetical protein
LLKMWRFTCHPSLFGICLTVYLASSKEGLTSTCDSNQIFITLRVLKTLNSLACSVLRPF